MENKVLFVDDEVHILKAIKRGLNKESYQKFYAASGEEALEIMEKMDIHVIVTDMKMPGMNGLDLLTKVNERYPNVVKIILSGYTQLQQIIVTINRIDIYKFITKPWDMEVEFKKVIRSAIDLYNTKVENEQLRESLTKKNILYQNLIKSNSEKLELMKNDFRFLEGLNKNNADYCYMLGVKFKQGEISEEQYRKALGFQSTIYGHIIGMMPTRHDEFNIPMLQDRLSKFLKTNVKKGNVVSRINITYSPRGHVYHGDYNIFTYIISSVLIYYFSLEHYDIFSLVISEKPVEEGKEEDKIQLNVLLKSESNYVVADPLRFHAVTGFYVNLIKAYKGSMSMENKNGENLVLMRFPFELKKE